MSKNPLHIVQLTAENVKRLRAVRITPEGNLVLIGGRNGQGKSSVLESIAMAIGGAGEKLEKPIHGDAEKGVVILNLGEIVVKRTFTKAGGGSLVVENADGAVYKSPQTILDALTTKLTFDPLGFTRMHGPAQKEALERMLAIDFRAHDAARQKVYEDRTEVNRTINNLRAAVALMPQVDAPDEEVDTAAIADELQKANDRALEIQRAKSAAVTAAAVAQQRREKVAECKEELARKERELNAARSTLAAAEIIVTAAETEQKAQDAHLATLQAIDAAPIRERAAGAAKVNDLVRKKKDRAAKIAEGQSAVGKANTLSAKLEEMDKEKAAKLKEIKFPVEGLSITDTGVSFNGQPFSQASQAEQIRVSVAIAAAANPQLRVMLVKDGSLMDKESLTLLGQLATEHNLQVWVERVGKDEPVSVVIEDGVVEGTEATPPAEEKKS